MAKYSFLPLFILIFISFLSCSKPEPARPTLPTDFEEYIAGYTSGKISTHGEIAISLAQEVEREKQAASGLFITEPEVAGKTEWKNDRTVIFKPAKALKQGEQYTVSFSLHKVMDVPKDKQTFVFIFSTLQQDMEIEFFGIEQLPGDRNQQQLKGTIFTADVVELDDVKRLLLVKQDGADPQISWTQDGQKKVHYFQVTQIQRKETASKVEVVWDGKPIGVDVKGKREIDVPAKGIFELLDTKVFTNQNPRIELTFSDPLDASQNLKGLVKFEKEITLSFIVNENKLTINPRSQKKGTQVLLIDEAIRSAAGKRLGTTYKREVRFYQPKPQVELLGKGVIIPRSSNLYLPFKAVSLGAVDVQVTRIFENNIGQFLQEDNLAGSDNWSIRRVGRPIYSGVIPLSSLGSVDAGTWNNYALDLSKLIEPQPGALYKVEIAFRKHQAIYPCEGDSTVTSANLPHKSWKQSPEEEDQYWQNFNNYYPEGYTWRDRENPCTVSYYNSDQRISRNVLASDLGIIAKRGEDDQVIVFTTDLRTAQPKAGVDITLFDYQQQKMTSASTNADGKAELKADHEPYYIMASSGDQKGYLRIDDGTSLSLSDFDISGANVQKGIKGFLYGERGVWRPGDTLFVSLILEDKNNVLPEDHPVTFELRDPSGQVSDRQTFNTSLNGFYVYEGFTDRQAPTGNWRLTAKVGGLTFTKILKIETVKPNRLKVEVDFPEDKITARTRKLEGTLSSQWLHGATAKNLKADVEMILTPSAPQFENFRNFSFSDEAISFNSLPDKILDGQLNGEGKVEFSHQLATLNEGPARLKVNLNLRVFEPSGNFSVGRASTFYYPFKTLIGIKPPETDNDSYGSWLSRNKAHTFKVVSVDTEGKPVGAKELEYEVYNIRWRWWWERGRENLSNFFERQNVRKVLGGKINTSSDGTIDLNIKLPEDEDGGRYLIRVKDSAGGHSASAVVYFSWWGGRNTSVSPARLTFTSDKKVYEVDDEITLNIPSSKGSKILVSLETGSRVLKTTWLDAQEGETKYTFTADRNMSPTVYAHVMHIQPHGQQQNDLPIRMYGVIPIEIEAPLTRLHPHIEMAAELKPEQQATIKISEKDGRTMTYTLAIVDDGLLDLTNFKTPQPHDEFYAREALGIKTWDMFEFVTSGFSGNISKILAVGGDGSEQEANPLNEANRFEPMVRFEGPFYLKAGAINKHTISIPNYVGSVRTMVIAGQNGAYGESEKTTPVRKPVMVLATLPRVLGPAETVSLPVSVFAMKEGVKNVQVRVEVNDMFDILGDPSSTVHFSEPGDELVTFMLKTKSKIGVGKVHVEVSSGNETAYHDIEIAVRNPNTPFVDVRAGILDEGKTWNVKFDPQGMVGTNSALLEVSRIPPIDFGKRLNYLIRYPHGCIEQTTSSVFPQLFVGKVMELSKEQKSSTQKNIQEGIARVEKFMTPSGGLGYWPGNEDANSWGTNYAYHFLLEAQKQGYYVSSDLMNRINRYQSDYARNWTESEYQRSDLIQAYRLYTLALANTPELGAMNRFRERKNLSPQAKWRIAAAYILIGQPEAADKILLGVSTNVPEYQELSGSFGSSLRDRSMILETLALQGNREDAALLARDISEELSSQEWLNTQTTAYGLIAVTKFLEHSDAAEEMKAGFTLNGSKKGSIRSGAYVTQIPLNMDELNANELILHNESRGTLFARLILQGKPLIGDNVSASNSLVQKVRFMNLKGEQIDTLIIEQGTDFIAEVSVSNPGLRGNYQEMALTQIFPSGWEIRNTRMDGEVFKEPTSSFEYQDIRDDRVLTYFDLKANQTKVYRVQLNASYLGEFYLPAVSTSAMYDESISARTPGNWVKVVVSN